MNHQDGPTLFWLEVVLVALCSIVLGALCLLLSGCAYYQQTTTKEATQTTFVLVGTGNRAASIGTNGIVRWQHSEIPQTLELASEGLARGAVKGAVGK